MEKKTLYLECNTGISGDMTVAALLDLGADSEVLKKTLDSIHDEGFEVKISRVFKAGIDCCDFDVKLDEEHENHDHDMAYLYGDGAEVHEHEHCCHGEHGEHDHEHEHCCHGEHGEHDHQHEHCCHGEHGEHEHEHCCHGEHGGHHHHHHHHRTYADIKEILGGLDMTEGAYRLAVKIFDILAAAESKAHNVPINEVHFHEVGALDSIVDIVAAAVCFDNLGITDVIIPKMCEGTGTVRCAHGILPVPVPAVLNIATEAGLPLQIVDRKGELITPTGAAFAAAVMTSNKLPENFIPKKVGYGAGKRAYEIPSMLRAVIVEPVEADNDKGTIIKLECNIDDCSGEQMGYALERLFDAGARDAHFVPVYMKKNRPGYELVVITDDEHVEKLEEIIFKETTTIGIRKQRMERTMLKRKEEMVDTEYGQIYVKISGNDKIRKVYPEYDSVKAAAERTGASFEGVYQAAKKAGSK